MIFQRLKLQSPSVVQAPSLTANIPEVMAPKALQQIVLTDLVGVGPFPGLQQSPVVGLPHEGRQQIAPHDIDQSLVDRAIHSTQRPVHHSGAVWGLAQMMEQLFEDFRNEPPTDKGRREITLVVNHQLQLLPRWDQRDPVIRNGKKPTHCVRLFFGMLQHEDVPAGSRSNLRSRGTQKVPRFVERVHLDCLAGQIGPRSLIAGQLFGVCDHANRPAIPHFRRLGRHAERQDLNLRHAELRRRCLNLNLNTNRREKSCTDRCCNTAARRQQGRRIGRTVFEVGGLPADGPNHRIRRSSAADGEAVADSAGSAESGGPRGCRHRMEKMRETDSVDDNEVPITLSDSLRRATGR